MSIAKVLCWLGRDHLFTKCYVCGRCGKTSHEAYLEQIKKRNSIRRCSREHPIRPKKDLLYNPSTYKDNSKCYRFDFKSPW